MKCIIKPPSSTENNNNIITIIITTTTAANKIKLPQTKLKNIENICSICKCMYMKLQSKKYQPF